MGLYDHTGTLLVNNNPIESYNPKSLHRYTSCLFQDFSKYSFTLRENVGIGNVSLMDDLQGIIDAIDRGGAERIREKVGLEGKLSDTVISDSAGEEGDSQGSAMVLPQEAQGPAKNSIGLGGLQGDGGIGVVKGKTVLPPSNAQTPLQASAHSVDSLPQAVENPPAPSYPSGSLSTAKDENKRTSLSGGQWQRVALARAFLRVEQADLVVFE
jgi:ABC-type multidrug transport system fused ATPase/permease subunit